MQSTHFSILSFLGALLPLTANAFTNCPLLGPDFPAPTNLSSSTTIQAALTNLTQIFDLAKTAGNTSYGVPFDRNITFSIEIFSIHDSQPTFSKSYPSDSIATYQDGSKTIDANTTYRIGSLTKLFTVYTFLIEAGDTKWNDPITKYVPELLSAAEALNATENPIDYVEWNDITIGDLASQLADIGRDYAGFGELDSPLGPAGADFQASAEGLPPLNATEVPLCYGGAYCSRQQFFAGFTERHPVYAPATAPIYSNAAYMILSYALENITGIEFPTSVQESLFAPLELSNGTSWFQPANNDSAIIPDNAGWSIPLGDETAAGGMYATPSDISAIGRSILLSTLLPSTVTRRWLKLHGLVSDPSTAVGAPWEIFRLPTSPSSRLVDLYTKSGDLPGYSSILALIPDWDMGFVVMAAADPTISNPTGAVVLLADMVADAFLPAFEVATREQADEVFSGIYSSSDPSLNSSIVLSTDPLKPGLGIDSWVSNGTDVLASSLAGPSARLYPTGLTRTSGDGETIMGFRLVFENPETKTTTGTFNRACAAWANVDGVYWGEVASDEFLITVGCGGVARVVEPRIMRVGLERV